MRLPLLRLAPVAVFLASCGPNTQADLVFRGGTVYTADSGRPTARAVAVRSGRIAYVGDENGATRWIGNATRVVDLGGGMLLPGFHDSHVHIALGGLKLEECDLADDRTQEAVTAHIARCARENPDAPWLRGRGWQLTIFRNANPSRELLDSLVPNRPAFFMAVDGHSAWLNSRALAAAGISAATPDPPNGRIERNSATGAPSGTLRDRAIFLVAPHLPQYTPAELEAGVRRALTLANSFGITSVHEASAAEFMLAAYGSLAQRGALTARVAVAVTVNPETEVGIEIARLEKLRKQYVGSRLRVIAAKIGADGVVESRTAALLKPYVGTSDRGPANLTPERYASLATALDRAGFQIHVHAIGDRAVRMSLDAIEAARKANGERDARHQIAHLQLIDSADLPRFRALGVAANFQPLWAYREEDIRDLTEPVLGPERSARLYPLGSTERAGAILVAGSDWSVTSMNPLAAIQVAITRSDPDGPGGDPWLPNERVSLSTILAAYTINGARLAFQEQETGSIVVGKAADLVVLDRDLFSIPAAEIHSARVRYTFVEGREVYAAGQ